MTSATYRLADEGCPGLCPKLEGKTQRKCLSGGQKGGREVLLAPAKPQK
jgi:hypothetical protein